MFSREFGRLCGEAGIAFNVLEPSVVDGGGASRPSYLQRIKTSIARYFISDIKALMVQWLQMRKERRQLLALNADVVLTRYDWNTLSIIWAARSLNIPVVIELNSPDEEDRGLKFYRLPGMTHFFSTKRALQLSDGAFAVSEALAKAFRPELEAADKPVHSIPNGVCLEQFTPKLGGPSVRFDLGIDDEKVVIGFVGSFAPWHGLDLLFEAFARLLVENANVHLLLVGQPRADSGAWLERAAAADIAPSITFAGHVPATEVSQYLAAMDITVLPNSAWYCSPLKVFEYMAMATAIVAVATEPVREMLNDRRDAALFEEGSVDELFGALKQLASDPVLRKSYGEAARVRVAGDYTWGENARRVFELLQTVEKKKKALRRASA